MLQFFGWEKHGLIAVKSAASLSVGTLNAFSLIWKALRIAFVFANFPKIVNFKI